MRSIPLDQHQLINAWISVLSHVTKGDMPRPHVFVEYRVANRPLDVMVAHNAWRVLWVCELKKANVDMEQAVRILEINRDTFEEGGFLKKDMLCWFIFVIGSHDRIGVVSEKLKELQKGPDHSTVGLEMNRNCVCVQIAEKVLEPEEILERMKQDIPYRRWVPLLIDESTVASTADSETSFKLDFWLLNGLAAVACKKDIIDWSEICAQLTRSWTFFSFSERIMGALYTRIKRLMKRFVSAGAVVYRSKTKDWEVIDREKLLRSLQARSAFSKELAEKRNKGQLLLFESNQVKD